jgi:superfamily II DNA/RNA helicase
VGRTARAGRAGEAYTIIKREEVKNFEKMVADYYYLLLLLFHYKQFYILLL